MVFTSFTTTQLNQFCHWFLKTNAQLVMTANAIILACVAVDKCKNVGRAHGQFLHFKPIEAVAAEAPQLKAKAKATGGQVLFLLWLVWQQWAL